MNDTRKMSTIKHRFSIHEGIECVLNLIKFVEDELREYPMYPKYNEYSRVLDRLKMYITSKSTYHIVCQVGSFIDELKHKIAIQKCKNRVHVSPDSTEHSTEPERYPSQLGVGISDLFSHQPDSTSNGKLRQRDECKKSPKENEVTSSSHLHHHQVSPQPNEWPSVMPPVNYKSRKNVDFSEFRNPDPPLFDQKKSKIPVLSNDPPHVIQPSNALIQAVNMHLHGPSDRVAQSGSNSKFGHHSWSEIIEGENPSFRLERDYRPESRSVNRKMLTSVQLTDNDIKTLSHTVKIGESRRRNSISLDEQSDNISLHADSDDHEIICYESRVMSHMEDSGDSFSSAEGYFDKCSYHEDQRDDNSSRRSSSVASYTRLAALDSGFEQSSTSAKIQFPENHREKSHYSSKYYDTDSMRHDNYDRNSKYRRDIDDSYRNYPSRNDDLPSYVHQPRKRDGTSKRDSYEELCSLPSEHVANKFGNYQLKKNYDSVNRSDPTSIRTNETRENVTSRTNQTKENGLHLIKNIDDSGSRETEKKSAVEGCGNAGSVKARLLEKHQVVFKAGVTGITKPSLQKLRNQSSITEFPNNEHIVSPYSHKVQSDPTKISHEKQETSLLSHTTNQTTKSYQIEQTKTDSFITEKHRSSSGLKSRRNAIHSKNRKSVAKHMSSHTLPIKKNKQLLQVVFPRNRSLHSRRGSSPETTGSSDNKKNCRVSFEDQVKKSTEYISPLDILHHSQRSNVVSGDKSKISSRFKIPKNTSDSPKLYSSSNRKEIQRDTPEKHVACILEEQLSDEDELPPSRDISELKQTCNHYEVPGKTFIESKVPQQSRLDEMIHDMKTLPTGKESLDVMFRYLHVKLNESDQQILTAEYQLLVQKFEMSKNEEVNKDPTDTVSELQESDIVTTQKKDGCEENIIDETNYDSKFKIEPDQNEELSTVPMSAQSINLKKKQKWKGVEHIIENKTANIQNSAIGFEQILVSQKENKFMNDQHVIADNSSIADERIKCKSSAPKKQGRGDSELHRLHNYNAMLENTRRDSFLVFNPVRNCRKHDTVSVQIDDPDLNNGNNKNLENENFDVSDELACSYKKKRGQQIRKSTNHKKKSILSSHALKKTCTIGTPGPLSAKFKKTDLNPKIWNVSRCFETRVSLSRLDPEVLHKYNATYQIDSERTAESASKLKEPNKKELRMTIRKAQSGALDSIPEWEMCTNETSPASKKKRLIAEVRIDQLVAKDMIRGQHSTLRVGEVLVRYVDRKLEYECQVPECKYVETDLKKYAHHMNFLHKFIKWNGKCSYCQKTICHKGDHIDVLEHLNEEHLAFEFEVELSNDLSSPTTTCVDEIEFITTDVDMIVDGQVILVENSQIEEVSFESPEVVNNLDVDVTQVGISGSSQAKHASSADVINLLDEDLPDVYDKVRSDNTDLVETYIINDFENQPERVNIVVLDHQENINCNQNSTVIASSNENMAVYDLESESLVSNSVTIPPSNNMLTTDSIPLTPPEKRPRAVIKFRILEGDRFSTRAVCSCFGCSNGGQCSLNKEIIPSESETLSKDLISKPLPPQFESGVVVPCEKVPGSEEEKQLMKVYKCFGLANNTCSFASNSISLLNHHLLNVHKKNKNNKIIDPKFLRCVYCGFNSKSFRNFRELQHHFSNEHKFCDYQCPYCFYRASRPKLVVLHLMKKHSDNVPRILISKDIENKTALLKHSNEFFCYTYIQSFVCNLGCVFTTFSYTKYASHIAQVHGGVSTWRCTLCSQVLISSESLMKHLEFDHHMAEMQCLYCPYGARNSGLMENHLAQSHPNLYPQYAVRKTEPKDHPYQNVLEHVKIEDIDSERALFNDIYKLIEDENVDDDFDDPEEIDKSDEDEIIIQNCVKSVLALIPQSNEVDNLDSGILVNEPFDLCGKKLCRTRVSSKPRGTKCVSNLNGRDLYHCGFENCSITAENEELLRTHLNTCAEQTLTPTLKCRFCRKIFSDISRFIVHLSATHGPDKFWCSYCDFKRPSKQNVMQHVSKSHRITKTKLLTDNANGVIKYYVVKDDSIDSSLLDTPLLDLPQLISFKSVSDVTQENRLSDYPAGRVVYNLDQLDKLSLGPIESEPIVCGLCSYSTKVSTNIQFHMKSHETGIASSKSIVNPAPNKSPSELMFYQAVNHAGYNLMKDSKSIHLEKNDLENPNPQCTNETKSSKPILKDVCESNQQWQCCLCTSFFSSNEIDIKKHCSDEHLCQFRYKCCLCSYYSDECEFADHFQENHQHSKILTITAYTKIHENQNNTERKGSEDSSIPSSSLTNKTNQKTLDSSSCLSDGSKSLQHTSGDKTKMLPDSLSGDEANDWLVEPYPSGEYRCPFCPAFKSKLFDEIRDHIYTEKKYLRYYCYKCGMDAVHKQDLLEHLKDKKIHPPADDYIRPYTVNDTLEAKVWQALKYQQDKLEMLEEDDIGVEVLCLDEVDEELSPVTENNLNHSLRDQEENSATAPQNPLYV